ncbi:MAG: MCE family protein [Chitinophagaceae bacterium]
MATLRYFLSFILTLSIFACSKDNKSKVTVLFDRVDNIEKGSKVYLKGIPVGEVTHLELFGDSVLADINLADTIKIPTDSKFIINPSLIGSAHITIEPSNKTTFLTTKDTASGFYLQKSLLDDMISDSARREKMQQSLDKIGEGIKELIESSRDTTKTQ